MKRGEGGVSKVSLTPTLCCDLDNINLPLQNFITSYNITDMHS